MKNMKKLISAALVAAVCVSCTACAKAPDMSDVFKDNEKISYSTSYTQLSDKTETLTFVPGETKTVEFTLN